MAEQLTEEVQEKERGLSCPALPDVPYSPSLTHPFPSLQHTHIHVPVLLGVAVPSLNTTWARPPCCRLCWLWSPFQSPGSPSLAEPEHSWQHHVKRDAAGWTHIVPVPCEGTYSAASCAGLICFRGHWGWCLQSCTPHADSSGKSPLPHRNRVN